MDRISFCVTYYNQESFVEKSLSSIFSMDIPCEFEVLVGDDGSSDNTLFEVKKFIDKYPNKIKIFIQGRKETQKTISRASANRLNIAKHATGNCIMFLDGDDYYCDNTFILKALTILKNNEDIIACGANYKYVYQDGREKEVQQPFQDGRINAEDYIAKSYYIHSGAFLFKNILTEHTLRFLEEINVFDDNAITIFMLQFGDLYYIDTPFYCYYQQQDSLWNKCDDIEKNILNAMDYKIISTIAPKFKFELLKRQYSALKNLYKNRLLLYKYANKYAESCKKNNDIFLLNLFNWNTIGIIQKLRTVIEWKLIKLSKKYDFLFHRI